SGSKTERASTLIRSLHNQSEKKELNVETVQLGIAEILTGHTEDTGIKAPLLKTRRTDLRPRSVRQGQYVENIMNHDITFGTGPAGTGKTWLAVACAIDAL